MPRHCPQCGAVIEGTQTDTVACPVGSVPATDPQKARVGNAVGEQVVRLVKSGRRPRDIITRQAIENAIAVVAATGGSTNAVLHLLAIAKEAGVELALPDFDRISAKTPLIADLKPSGRFVATDLHAAGGSPLVVKRLIDSGHVAGNALTVTGNTLADDAAQGHPIGLKAMRRAGHALGIAIASATDLCDLEVVSIGGGLSQAGSLLFDPLEEALRCHVGLDFARDVVVVPAALGQSAGLVGAAALLFAADRYWAGE